MEISCVIFGLLLNRHIFECEMVVDQMVLFSVFQMNLMFIIYWLAIKINIENKIIWSKKGDFSTTT